MATLLRQSRGLSAPAPPRSGALVANETGWLLGVGGPVRRSFPRLVRWGGRAGGLVAAGPLWAELLGIRPGILGLLALGMSPLALFWAGLWMFGLPRLRLRLRRTPQVARLADARVGSFMRVAGVVAAQPCITSLFRGLPAVLFRNQAGGADEIRGVDFHLDLASGERVTISVRGALLLDRPRRTRRPPACGRLSVETLPSGFARLRSEALSPASFWSWARAMGQRESAIAPGDQIEVCGVLDRQVDPAGDAPPGRQPPMRYLLRGDDEMPLLVRRAG